MNRNVRVILVLFTVVSSALTGCSRQPLDVHSIATLRKALPGRGWPEVSYHPVDAATLAQAGITAAGLIRSGDYRMEVYEVGRIDSVTRVADLFAATGDVVFTGGMLVVLVPIGPDIAAVSERLTNLGLLRHGTPR
ncbi:MAG TPA: hypothetical protein PKC67_00690 [Kiritimatiellia bacterium]|nr:hypothetical protein [Kiritimatiellia bacterium]HMP32837.1 hypothetical protein [Kiritimatiellia bacterium]